MLMRVVDENNMTELRKLLKKTDRFSVSGWAVTDHEIHICLPRAASAGRVDSCRLLFQRLSKQGQETYTRQTHIRGFGALHEAALMGHVAVLQLLLLQFHCNVNQLNEIHATPLSTALPCLTTTRFLLQNGADPNLPNQGPVMSWPLYWAVSNDQSSVDLVQLLLEFGANPNFNFTSLQQLQEYNAHFNINILTCNSINVLTCNSN
jgi:ankyrin repeat protein